MSLMVVEGIDGCGKTTIAKLLSEKLGVPYHKCFLGGKWDWIFKISKSEGIGGGYEDFVILDLVDRAEMNLILDRSYPSAVVYSNVQKRGLWPECNPKMTGAWIDAFNSADGIMIWIRANAYECYKRNPEKPVSELARLEEEYQWFFNEYGKQFDHYLEMHNEIAIDKVVESITQWLDKGAKNE